MRRGLSDIVALFILWTFSLPVLARTLEFQTTQVTAPDVALSPNGQTLVFTMLGHLFSLPSIGGTAEQLTFGPYYDKDPVCSPEAPRSPLLRIAMAAMGTFLF